VCEYGGRRGYIVGTLGSTALWHVARLEGQPRPQAQTRSVVEREIVRLKIARVGGGEIA